MSHSEILFEVIGKSFQLFREAAFFLIVLLGELIRKSHKRILLLLVEIFRDFEYDFYHLIAASVTLQLLYALAAQPEYRVRLRSGRYVVGNVPVDSRNGYLVAEHRLRICYRYLRPE